MPSRLARVQGVAIAAAAIVVAAAIVSGCTKPCQKLADKTCEELGEGSLCTVARFRALRKDVDQKICESDLKAWPRTLARLKGSQAAINQLDRIAPGATKIKVLPMPKDGGLPHIPEHIRRRAAGAHTDDDGRDHGRAQARPDAAAPSGPAAAGDGGAAVDR